MPRHNVDQDGLNSADVRGFYDTGTPDDIPFSAGKISHVVVKVQDLARSTAFYTQVMGFRVSDAYPGTMMPGGMVFLRCNRDHHGVALVGGGSGESTAAELHHFAFEVETVDELFRAREHLRRHGIALDFEGRRRAGQQIALEFRDPDGHSLEICWGMDQLGPDDAARPPEQWQEARSLEEAVRNPPHGQQIALADASQLDS